MNESEASPPRSWQEPDMSTELLMPDLTRSATEPLFMHATAHELNPGRLRILGKLDMDSETAVFRLMQEMEIAPNDEADVETVHSAIHAAKTIVTEEYQASQSIAGLRRVTQEFEALPLVRAAIFMRTAFASLRNIEVELITRILVGHETSTNA